MARMEPVRPMPALQWMTILPSWVVWVARMKSRRVAMMWKS